MKIVAELLLPTYSLWLREVIRFVRQRSRMIGVLGSPILFWFFIGSGLGGSFRMRSTTADVSYLEFFYPGTLLLIMLFTSIFSTISIIEDKREGFLQSVLVAPISSAGIALGKILGGASLAVLQAIVFLPFALLIGFQFSILQVAGLIALLSIVGFGLTGLGFLIAWRMESTQGFHAIMNLFLIPLWLLSGALFPAEGAQGWLRGVMSVNPLTYSVFAIREVLYHRAGPDPRFMFSILVTVLFDVIALFVSMIIVRRRS